MNDISDEAFWQFYSSQSGATQLSLKCWREAARRAAADKEEALKGHEEAYSETCHQNDWLRKLVKDLADVLDKETSRYEAEVGQPYNKHASLLAVAFRAAQYTGANAAMKQEKEEAVRRAFEAGWKRGFHRQYNVATSNPGTTMLENDFDAYQAERAKEQR